MKMTNDREMIYSKAWRLVNDNINGATMKASSEESVTKLMSMTLTRKYG